MQVSEHVHLLEIAGDRGVTYPALIQEGRELILVDAGYPMETAKIKQAVVEAGFAPEAISYILLTHQDIDHIGCAKELVATSGAQTGAHEIEAPYIQGDKVPVKLAAQEARFPSLSEQERAFVRMLREAFDRRKLLIDLWLKDGEVLPVCGMEVIHTPGHTPGHACFYVPNDRVMIAGDALNVEAGELTGPNPHHTADMEQALASLTKLAARDVRHTVTYHGGLYTGDLRQAIGSLPSRS